MSERKVQDKTQDTTFSRYNTPTSTTNCTWEKKYNNKYYERKNIISERKRLERGIQEYAQTCNNYHNMQVHACRAGWLVAHNVVMMCPTGTVVARTSGWGWGFLPNWPVCLSPHLAATPRPTSNNIKVNLNQHQEKGAKLNIYIKKTNAVIACYSI